MAKQVVDVGTVPNDGTGDPLRQAMIKINSNFNEVYRAVGGVGSDTLLNMVSNNAIQVLNTYNPISFLLDNEAELYALNPSAYHGCIAHVHSTGSVYYAHVKWNKLLTDNANNDVQSYADSLATIAYTGLLTDANTAGFSILSLGITDGANGQVLSTDGAGTFTFVDQTGGAGGGAAANTFGTIVVAGQSNVVSDSTSDVLTLVAGTGVTITTNAATDTITFSANTSGGGGGFTPTRVTQAVSTSNIANGVSENISFGNLGLSYVLHKVAVDYASRVRIYADAASQTADSSRPQGTDPIEGSGVIAEFIASAANTFLITPGIYGFIETGNTIPVTVTNLSGSTYPINVTLTGLKLEE